MSKVLHINCACTGSTGKIIGDIADHSTSAGYIHLLCSPGREGDNKNIRYFKTSLPYEQGLYRRLNYLYGYQYGFAPLATAKIKRIIKKEKPDIIHLHSVNGFMVNVYALLRLIRKLDIPVVITNHAEFFYTGNCPYSYECNKWRTGCGSCPQKEQATGGKLWDTSAHAWKKMQRVLGNLPKVAMVSVSPWVESRAKSSPITVNLPHKVVLNGVNTDLFTCRNATELRHKYGFSSDEKLVFHPTANFSANPQDRKGGCFVIALAQQLAGQGVKVLVAGKHTPDMVVPENMILLGQVSDQTCLAEYYTMSDVTVVAGKRETFNMPVAESLCCGTPVVGFQAGGPESIAIPCFSHFVPYGDVSELTSGVLHMMSETWDKSDISQQAQKQYGADIMAAGYMNVYQELLTDRGI